MNKFSLNTQRPALLFILVFLLSFSTFGKKKENYGKKYLTVYMGIRHMETLSHLPPGAEFSGDYNSFLKVDVDRERKTLRFTPKRPGLSTLTVHDRKGEKLFEYRIDTRKSELTKVVREVRGLLYDIEGVTIKIVNNKVIIDGYVMLPNDLNRIFAVKKQFGDGLVDSLVEISPIAQKKIAEYIEKEINNPDIEVRAVNGKFILKGIANSADEKATAEIIAKTFVPPPVINEAEAAGVIKKRKEIEVINLLSIRASPPAAPEKIIQIVVHYVEMSKKYLRSAAFQWAPGVSDNTSVNFTKDTTTNSDGIVTEIAGVISNLLPKLNSAKSHGFARVLQSTSVTTKDGKKGYAESAQELTFNVRDPANINVAIPSKVKAGVWADITPKVVNPRSDIIELDMKFNVSTIMGITADGPQVAKNVINTVVNVRSGQSAAVGGLISNDTGTEYNPEPGTDALFNLYSSKSFRRNKTQFVVFVTPTIKSSASSGSEKIKRKFRLRE